MFASLRRFVPLLLILIGSYACLGYAPWCALRAHREARWPVVEGHMREVSVERVMGRRFDKWQVVLSYEYRPGRTLRIGDQWATGHDLVFFTQAGATERAREFLPGTNVTVHYDPDDPSEAVLELRYAQDAWYALGFGLLLIAFGVTRWRADRCTGARAPRAGRRPGTAC